MSNADLVQTLIESFGTLADEVQSLIDRKTILQHKLAFAHEQVRPSRLTQLCFSDRPRFHDDYH